MIIEDEKFSASVLQKTLERLGYEVVANVQNSQDAIEKFKIELPDVILLDFNIQGELDGGDLSKVLDKIKPTAKIFMTSSEDEESLQKIMDAKPDAYIQKPFEPRELRAVLELAFYKKQKEKELNDLLNSLDKKVKERTRELNELVKELKTEVSAKEAVQKRLEESLQTEKKFGELKSSLISNLSHEFKTPLSTIRSSAQLLTAIIERKKFESLNVKISTRIEESVDHLRDVFTRILMVEETAGKAYNALVEQMDLSKLIDDLLSELKPGLCSNVTINLDKRLDSNLIKSDPRLLKLIISNVLSNACKYSDPGGEIFVKISLEQSTLFFQVQDHGIGMSPNDLNQIFYRFYRGENVGSIEGTGIGMSIMKKSLDALDGKVEIDSQINVGTLVKIEIPVQTI